MEKAKYVKTPLTHHFKLSTNQYPTTKFEINDMKLVLYANLVSSDL